jgi:hypothetical protein
MVSQNYMTSSDPRRFTNRIMSPYPPPYQDRRLPCSPHEMRGGSVGDRDSADDSPAQRKRIAVAVDQPLFLHKL